MFYTTIKSRDGLDLVSYYTLPVWADKDKDGLPEKPLAMVLLVHGGPWERDVWGFDALHQLLSNRGYAVLSVNFRGSTGFGKSFTNAGDREWGRKMEYDLLDAVNWSIDRRNCRPFEDRHNGRKLRRLCRIGRHDLYPKDIRLRS